MRKTLSLTIVAAFATMTLGGCIVHTRPARHQHAVKSCPAGYHWHGNKCKANGRGKKHGHHKHKHHD